MSDARGRDNWSHTSTLLAMIANVNRDPKKTSPFKPSDFDPYRTQPSKPARVGRKVGFEMLKATFCGAAK